MNNGFYFNQELCISCYACVVGCKDWHDVPAGPASYIRIKTFEGGKYPNPRVDHLFLSCLHCAEPRCVAVCPAGAISKREKDGIVVVDRDKCRTGPGCGIIVGEVYGKQQAPCKISCPAHLNPSVYIALIAKGKFKEALDAIWEQVPLPGVVGRVCHHPCETVCKRQELDEPVSICHLKRFVSDYVTDYQPSPAPRTKEEKVAIIGSGPAGLAAAYFLARKGYGVTIFEALSEPGGMLMSGIPRFRLPKDVVKREIEYIKGLGVDFRLNTPIGLNPSLDDLKSRHGYNAIFIATGAHNIQSLGIPGENLENVFQGVPFLRDINVERPVTVTGKVIVIGGGNTAIDSARSALRLGAKEVTIIYRRSREEMPAIAEEIDEAEREGVKITYLTAPVRLIGNKGKVESVQCIQTRLGEPDARGRRQPIPVKGSEFLLAADIVVVAIGETPELAFLGDSKLELTEGGGAIAVNAETEETSYPGIFAGGDVIGTGYVISAIAAGKKAAASIDFYLQNLVIRTNPITATSAQPIEWGDDVSKIKVEIPAGVKKEKRQNKSMLSLSEIKGNFREVVQGFTEEAAIFEAKRCLNCAGHLCLEACPYDAPQFGADKDAKMQK